MADPTACANGLIAGQGSIYWKEGMASCTACGHNYLHSKKDPATCAKWKSAYAHSRRDVNGTS